VKVKILGINAGPRLGNTAVLVKEALKAAEAMEGVETEFISMHDHPVTPCNVCHGERLCYGDKKGIFPDSTNYCYMFGQKKNDHGNMFVDKFVESDGIILGSPTHEWDYSCECKALFSRLRAFCEHVLTPFHGKMRNKPIGAVTTSFNKWGGAETTIFAMLRWGMGMGMIPVGSETTEPDRAPNAGPFGGIGNVGDAKLWWDEQAILPENSRVSPPTTSIQALRSSRCVGRNVTSVAIAMKNGIALLESNGYHLPKGSLPKKWPKAFVNEGSYLEYLAGQGEIELV
jgi:multimeric flavodoxin WrbA